MNTISNYCRFIGRLTQDPEIVKVENTQLCKFTLAVTEYRQEKYLTVNIRKRKALTILTLKLGIQEPLLWASIARRAI